MAKSKDTTQKKKKRLSAQANDLWKHKIIELWGDRCDSCGKMAEQVHHFYTKGAYGHLKFDLDNGIPICMGCHFAHHTKSDPNVHQRIIEKRGAQWHARLVEKSRNRPESSYKTLAYYQEVIESLQ